MVFCWAGIALAEKRVALVIGNSNYDYVSTLANPTNDADDITIALEKLGFEVTKEKDLGYQEMRLALREFSDKSQGSEIALLYYAGHGIEVDKHNYLIPTDARLKKDIDVEFEAMSLDSFSRAVSGAKSLRLILLDACRDNPFANTMVRTVGTRSIGRGLARIEPKVGTLVSYAAKEGTVAADGNGRNSPYTGALIKHLDEAGLEVQFLFRKVRDSVVSSTDGKQEPFTYGSLPGKHFFLKAPEANPPPKPALQKPTNDNSVELALWDSIKSGDGKAYFQIYLDRYPAGVFSDVARLKIKAIEKREMEQAAERQKKEQQVALLDPAKGTNQSATSDISSDKPASRREIVLGVQNQLNRLGCSVGNADGQWGGNSTRGLSQFKEHSKQQLASLDPTESLLNLLKGLKTRVCPAETETLANVDTDRSGFWNFTRIASNPSSCGWKSSSTTLSIENDKISGGNYAGKVAENGSVQVTQTFTYKGKTERNLFRGTLKSDKGSGKFQHIGGGCKGRFTMSKL
jgi:uncharacterized caspase-like protein